MKRILRPEYNRGIIIYANRASSSAGTLGRGLVCRRWLVERERLQGRTISPDRLVVNWGTTSQPRWFNPRGIVLNGFEAVARSISKVQSYTAFAAAGVPTLEFTTDAGEAEVWLNQGNSVLARRDGLTSGRGIRILRSTADIGSLGEADFYTRYFPKTHEYRVHVFNPRTQLRPDNRADGEGGARPDPRGDGGVGGGQSGSGEIREQSGSGVSSPGNGSAVEPRGVIDITQKKRAQHDNGAQSTDRTLYQRVGIDSLEPQVRTLQQRIVRSHNHGWIHAHENIHLPAAARDIVYKAAVDAVRSLGLDFGAVDILARYSKKNPNKLKSLAVCEVNTAPGLENQVTIEAYCNAIKGCQSSLPRV